MAVSLDKFDPCWDLGDGPDREEWRSCILLPMYLGAIYPFDDARHVYIGLKYNNLLAFRRLLIMERTYDNTTGQYVEER